MPFLPATSPPPNPLFYVGNSKTSWLTKRSQGFCPRLLFLERSPPLSTTEALHQMANPFFGSTLGTRVSGKLLKTTAHHLAEPPATALLLLLLLLAGHEAFSFPYFVRWQHSC